MCVFGHYVVRTFVGQLCILRRVYCRVRAMFIVLCVREIFVMVPPQTGDENFEMRVLQ